MNSLSTSCIAALLVVLTVGSLFAQSPAIKPAPTPAPTDSTRQLRSASDSIPTTIRRNGVRVGTSILTPENDSTSLDRPDTVRLTAKQEREIHKIVPRKATMRALVPILALGQAYNRQYYKMPFVYAGYAVMGYLFVKYRGLAQEAATGYRRLLFGDVVAGAYNIGLDTGIYPSNLTGDPTLVSATYVKPEYVVIGPYQYRSATGAKNAYDTYRRYRDLNVLLSVALYAVSIVEANVAAHLKTFDLSDDISMNVEPSVLPTPGVGLVPGVRVAFTFK
ncbi:MULTISPECIES: DUF5683 domain-containing protein [unclassified Spirosoma]|uniref:DUF5683 domain-containing protein n=1 Tax=unclassified Spirosoma TaxID=2621999 RepID=UPI0009673D81|nr:MULTISPECIES: DUF5683 domain-containing protein [unclassified Spirosoma]MBN8822310.1 hypothetical protein [Spirosoma sp.]OJW72389.1 MAG: hypothetical protein BGO59_14710 [Spirosoma sp. 48-14]